MARTPTLFLTRYWVTVPKRVVFHGALSRPYASLTIANGPSRVVPSTRTGTSMSTPVLADKIKQRIKVEVT